MRGALDELSLRYILSTCISLLHKPEYALLLLVRSGTQPHFCAMRYVTFWSKSDIPIHDFYVSVTFGALRLHPRATDAIPTRSGIDPPTCRSVADIRPACDVRRRKRTSVCDLALSCRRQPGSRAGVRRHQIILLRNRSSLRLVLVGLLSGRDATGAERNVRRWGWKSCLPPRFRKQVVAKTLTFSGDDGEKTDGFDLFPGVNDCPCRYLEVFRASHLLRENSRKTRCRNSNEENKEPPIRVKVRIVMTRQGWAFFRRDVSVIYPKLLKNCQNSP